MPRRLIAPSSGTTVKDVVPLIAGGLGVTTAPDALTVLNAIPANTINQPFGIAGLGADGKLNSSIVPVGNQQLPAIISSTYVGSNFYVGVNLPGQFTINNYDSFTTYDISCSAGTVSRVNEIVTYTGPATPGTYTLTINGKSIPINVITLKPATPVITSPVGGSQNLPKNVTLTSSAFQMYLNVGTDTHLSSDWQVATDSNFTNVVVSAMDDTTNKTSKAVQLPAANTTYYARVRHKGTTYGYGNWSTAISFTTRPTFIALYSESVIQSPVPTSNENFSRPIAISGDGTRLAIIARKDGAVTNGALYIFLRSGSTWTQETKISFAGPSDLDFSIDIDSTGTRVVIGNPSIGVNSKTNAGQAYIYVRSGTSWSLESTLDLGVASNTDNMLGYKVAFDSSATRVAIVELNSDDSGGASADIGAVHILSRSGSTWTYEQKLMATVKNNYEGMGRGGIAFDSNATRIVVGSPYRPQQNPYVYFGGAYIFTRSGTTWSQEALLVASDIVGTNTLASCELFGKEVAMSSDGTRVAIGCSKKDAGFGAVYVFTRSGTTWSQEAKISLSTPSTSDHFGWRIAMDSTGTNIAATLGISPSHIYYLIYSRSGTTWSQAPGSGGGYFTSNDPNTLDLIPSENYDSFDMTADGTRIVWGVPGSTINNLTNAGVAVVFA